VNFGTPAIEPGSTPADATALADGSTSATALADGRTSAASGGSSQELPAPGSPGKSSTVAAVSDDDVELARVVDLRLQNLMKMVDIPVEGKEDLQSAAKLKVLITREIKKCASEENLEELSLMFDGVKSKALQLWQAMKNGNRDRELQKLVLPSPTLFPIPWIWCPIFRLGVDSPTRDMTLCSYDFATPHL